MTEKRYSILAVDDTKSNIKILMQYLRPEFEVTPALSGQQALDILTKLHVDLVLLDIMMPEMDGYEVCKRLKENEATHTVPIIFITAQTDEDAIERAYDVGGSDYVTKPFRPKELLARIHQQLQLRELIQKLEDARKEQEILATTDAMTGLYNRRAFGQFAINLLGQAKRSHSNMSLCMCMLDIDKFKRINDTYGHDIGDEVIISVANRMKDMVRSGDVVARIGGEEFAILLHNATKEGAYTVAERLRQKVEDYVLEVSPGEILKFTISVGVTMVVPENEDNMEPALKRADIALYQAKEGGRNQVVSNWP